MTETEILKRAKAAFAKHDRLKAQMMAVELQIKMLCADYRQATKTWITRPESLRNAVEAREGRKAA
jgi:hypothetical protein